MNNQLQTGNIGVVTTRDDTLCEITGIANGLLYCVPIHGPKVVRVCLPDQFWALLDAMP